MRGGLRRHVIPLASALATAILLVVPGCVGGATGQG